MEFDPKAFKMAPPREPVNMFWGGGHTLETDPTRKGWRVRLLNKNLDDPNHNKVWLVGRPGKIGCASIQSVRDGLDVAIYLETPKEIADCFEANGRISFDCRYKEFDEYPGVGLAIIRVVEQDLKICGLA